MRTQAHTHTYIHIHTYADMHTRTVMALTKERGDKARLSDHRRRSQDVKTRECLDRHSSQEISPRVTSTKHVKTLEGVSRPLEVFSAGSNVEHTSHHAMTCHHVMALRHGM